MTGTEGKADATIGELRGVIGGAYAALTEISASLALIAKACRQALAEAQTIENVALDTKIALHVSAGKALSAQERIADVASTLTRITEYVVAIEQQRQGRIPER